MTAVAAAAAVAIAVPLTAGSQAGGGVSAVHSLRARLLAAIDAARGDILIDVRAVWPGTAEYRLIYPWYPRTGQQVRILNNGLGRAADGKVAGSPGTSSRCQPGTAPLR